MSHHRKRGIFFRGDSPFFQVSYLVCKKNIMKEVFQEYGGIIITIVAIVALVAVIRAVIGGSVVSTQFTNAITNFFTTISPT